MHTVERPQILDVTKTNPRHILYIQGDDFTDGSIRFMFDATDDVANIELRTNGVWNDTGLRFSSSSVKIGRDLVVSAAAGFIETGNPSGIIGHIRSLIPHIQFEDAGTLQPQTPILDAEKEFDVFTGAVSEIINTVIGINLGVSPGRVLEESIHEVGSVGSTATVDVTFHLGTDNTGFVIDKRRLSADSMVADTTLVIEYDNDLGFQPGQAIFMQFLSTENISLKTDAFGNPLTIHEAHELSTEGIVTENLMIDVDFNLMFDESLNPMYAIQFP